MKSSNGLGESNVDMKVSCLSSCSTKQREHRTLAQPMSSGEGECRWGSEMNLRHPNNVGIMDGVASAA